MPIFPPPFKKSTSFRPSPRVKARFTFKDRSRVVRVSKGYHEMTNGQMVRIKKKVHKTKKERVKARREARGE